MGNKVVMSVGVITTILLSEACSLLIKFLIRIYCEGKNVRKCIKLPTAAWSWVNVQPCNYGDGKNEIFLHCRKILYNVYSTTQREWAIKVCTLCIALLNDLPVADGFNYFKNYLVIIPQNYPYSYDVNVNLKSELKQFFSHLKFKISSDFRDPDGFDLGNSNSSCQWAVVTHSMLGNNSWITHNHEYQVSTAITLLGCKYFQETLWINY